MRLPVFRIGCGLLTACSLLTACGLGSDDGRAVGSKGLWVANGSNVVEYNPAQLGSGTAATAPHVSINSEVSGSPQGVAFDPMGNLWVVDSAAMIKGTPTPALYEFSAAQLAALGTDNAPDPVAIITSAFIKTPHQIVIDPLGNAWIADSTANAVMTYTAAQLAQAGSNSIGPVLLISSSQFNGASGIAFDSIGNIWVSNIGTTTAAGTTLVEIAKAHIPAIPETGTSTPQVVADVTVTDAGGATIQGPWGVAIDSSDTMWWSNSAKSTVVGLPGASLATSTSAPSVTLSSTMVNSVATLNQPQGICIDDVGNIAVINATGSFGIAVFGTSQLTSGSPTPATFIVGAATTLNDPQGCTFGPTVK
jgi:sugar lactone lactonase YvrE